MSHSHFKRISVVIPRLDAALSNLASKLSRFTGIVDAGMQRYSGGSWFVDAWRVQSIDGRNMLHRSWVVRLGRTEVSIDFRPVQLKSSES